MSLKARALSNPSSASVTALSAAFFTVSPPLPLPWHAGRRRRAGCGSGWPGSDGEPDADVHAEPTQEDRPLAEVEHAQSRGDVLASSGDGGGGERRGPHRGQEESDQHEHPPKAAAAMSLGRRWPDTLPSFICEPATWARSTPTNPKMKAIATVGTRPRQLLEREITPGRLNQQGDARKAPREEFVVRGDSVIRSDAFHPRVSGSPSPKRIFSWRWRWAVALVSQSTVAWRRSLVCVTLVLALRMKTCESFSSSRRLRSASCSQELACERRTRRFAAAQWK